MVQLDIDDINVICNNCGKKETINIFELPYQMTCCDNPDIKLIDDIELEIS